MKLSPIIILTVILICFTQLATAKEPKEFANNFFKMVQSGKI
jgi:hypothetical protein